jgi:RNA methyltransferase, TrmH family
MLSKAKIKSLRSLAVKKYRQKDNKYIIEGFRLLQEAITSGTNIIEVWFDEKLADEYRETEFLEYLKNNNIPFSFQPTKEINQISETRNSQGIICLLDLPHPPQENEGNILVLDDISDPGNLGTILRTAAWFGIKTVVLSENSVDAFNPKVVRSAMGAHFHLNIIQINHLDVLQTLSVKKYQILGADMNGIHLNDIELAEKQNWALVLGNEAHGLNSGIHPFLTHKITIPRIGNIESLNVSIAGGIILSKICK